MQLDKVYEPQRFEPRWAQSWIDSGIFHAPTAESSAGRDVFTLVIPPPNVTGSLHMGHMLEHTEIDVTIRWHRMRGDATLWLPGTDHAGIATQMVVERQLAAEGTNRHALGREAFEERVWKWKAESGGTIKRQMIQVGASCDWSRERFTLDEGLNRAVRETFCRLYEKGLIYRGTYMINWCPRCQTALSDLEVDHAAMPGSLWHIRYPVIGTDEFLTVATTRPESMLGDTAVAINARDTRYQHLHGKTVRLPLMDREIPIVLDDMADPEFGTGCVKVTPAHDLNDFECGRRHNLPSISVIDTHARITAAGGVYAGLDRYEARKRIAADLEQQGYLVKTEPYALSAGQCQRCKTVVEPLVSTQWFCKMKPLAEPAIACVEDDRIRFIPEAWTKTYFEWMRNIRDWCVSRQLWWGHRIPAWHCKDCGDVTVARETPAACGSCQSAGIVQDPDVLDTWFSSGLWPFSTMGWPEQTEDLARFYPTSLLITGFDILFFWVARMIMLGLEMMGDVPFRQVYIHGLVRDAERQKMSKTKGNVIDPLEVTVKYGTDAVRMSLLQGAAPGTDIVLTDERMQTARAFANKIWNAARFVFLKMEQSGVEPWVPGEVVMRPVGESPSLEDRWIFSRLNRCADQMNRSIANYRYHEAAQTAWGFFWHEFCDWYVELKKLRFTEGSGLTADWKNMLTVFESALRLLHPVMPFLTEELWQRVAANWTVRPQSIALTAYPQCDTAGIDEAAESDMGLLQEIITAARNLRAELKLDPKEQLSGVLYSSGRALEVAGAEPEAVSKLAGVKLDLRAGQAPKLGGAMRATPDFDLGLEVPAAQLEVLRKRLEKEIEQLDKTIANSQRQLGDEKFLSRAPDHVVAGIREKLAEYESQVAKSRESLAALGGAHLNLAGERT
ncbi:MAG: valine--tRNA ligase [Acidobacteria bacterium]|nr:valine--tRNA ligase [Acidobacteriota bacterium]